MNDKQTLYTIVYKTQAWAAWETQRAVIEEAVIEFNGMAQAQEVLRKIMDMK